MERFKSDSAVPFLVTASTKTSSVLPLQFETELTVKTCAFLFLRFFKDDCNPQENSSRILVLSGCEISAWGEAQ